MKLVFIIYIVDSNFFYFSEDGMKFKKKNILRFSQLYESNKKIPTTPSVLFATQVCKNNSKYKARQVSTYLLISLLFMTQNEYLEGQTIAILVILIIFLQQQLPNFLVKIEQ